LTAKSLDFSNIVPKVLDELDYPQCSWGTGHADPEDCPYQHPVPGIDGVFSIYEGMRQRNRCNTNDYQNIGVNGARITASMNLAKSLQRDTVRDKPALVWLSLMGNDVCNGHEGFDHMTTPETYYEKAMETLRELDTKLPPGSFVVTPGMFDGVLLYDTMHAQQHPLGTTYEALYDFMNCLGESPCWGWLNSDISVRRKTQDIANSLNEVSRQLESEDFQNFKFLFYEVPWKEMFAEYAKSGEPLTNLIEKVDGFHPSQAGNALFAQNFFGWLEREHEESLGGTNPFNDEIDSIFF
jgi:acyloxyacyl hydrolase